MSEILTDKLLEAGVYTSYVHSSITFLKSRKRQRHIDRESL